MNNSEICKTIENKFKDWVDSITDIRIKQLIRENCIITGGSIASMILNENINDFDVYMRTKESAFLLARYYCDKVPFPCWPKMFSDKILIELPQGNPIKKKKPIPGYNVAYISPLAISLTDKIQITVRFFGTPGKIHQNYDFVHCTCYWTSWDRKLVTPKAALDAIKKKKLLYIGSKYPIASIVRIKKFVSKGWSISANQIIKMSVQVSDLNLEDKEELKEQLVGMYSKDLTKVVEDTKIDDNGKVNRDSLFKAIDKHLKE